MTSQNPRSSALGFGPLGAARMSFSGRERNKFFRNDGDGKTFADQSYVSGLDSAQDGRVFARADLDHDGDEDVILVSRNAPILRVFRNDVGRSGGNFLGLALRGDGKTSNRDAIGARVTAKCDDHDIVRHVNGGEGFATRAASALTIGLGPCAKPSELIVQFPSGRTRSFKTAGAGHFYALDEDGPLRAVPEFYAERAAPLAAEAPGFPLLSQIESRRWKASKPLVYVSFWASWCASCKREQPRVNALVERFGEQVDFVGLSLEPEDTPDVVREYHSAHDIPYPLVALKEVAHAKAIDSAIALFESRVPALPAAVLLDGRTGAVLWHDYGVATISDVERALRARTERKTPTRSRWWLLTAMLAVVGWIGLVIAWEKYRK